MGDISNSAVQITITLNKQQAIRIQSFLGAWFSSNVVKIHLGKLQYDLNQLQRKLHAALYESDKKNAG